MDRNRRDLGDCRYLSPAGLEEESTPQWSVCGRKGASLHKTTRTSRTG